MSEFICRICNDIEDEEIREDLRKTICGKELTGYEKQLHEDLKSRVACKERSSASIVAHSCANALHEWRAANRCLPDRGQGRQIIAKARKRGREIEKARRQQPRDSSCVSQHSNQGLRKPSDRNQQLSNETQILYAKPPRPMNANQYLRLPFEELVPAIKRIERIPMCAEADRPETRGRDASAQAYPETDRSHRAAPAANQAVGAISLSINTSTKSEGSKRIPVQRKIVPLPLQHVHDTRTQTATTTRARKRKRSFDEEHTPESQFTCHRYEPDYLTCEKRRRIMPSKYSEKKVLEWLEKLDISECSERPLEAEPLGSAT